MYVYVRTIRGFPVIQSFKPLSCWKRDFRACCNDRIEAHPKSSLVLYYCQLLGLQNHAKSPMVFLLWATLFWIIGS